MAGPACPQFGHTRAAPGPASSLRAAARNAAERADGDEVAGRVRVKVGPVTASYAGTARFVTKDEAAHRFVLEGNGRETRGTGTASATVEVSMSEQDAVTQVRVVTSLEGNDRQAGAVRPWGDGRHRGQADRSVRRVPGRTSARACPRDGTATPISASAYSDSPRLPSMLSTAGRTEVLM
jgi:hypothetical protein